MEEIPEDVRKIAEAEALKYVEWLTPKPAEYGQATFVLSQSFARAILAERERCAKVAEARIAAGFADLPEMGDAYLQGSISSATIIASAIRSPLSNTEETK